MSLIVLCAGGHARVVIEALRSRGIRPSAVMDRDTALLGGVVGGVPITGPDEDILKMSVGCGRARQRAGQPRLAHRFGPVRAAYAVWPFRRAGLQRFR